MARKRKSAGRVGLSASLVIAALFVGSGLIRFAGDTSSAIAREFSELSAKSGTTSSSPRDMGMTAEGLDRIVGQLRERETVVAARSHRLDMRAKDLDASQRLLEDKLLELEEAENSLRALIAIAETAAEGDLTQLTSVYENMKPKEAASIFEEMAPAFAAGFLGRMEPEAAAKIFAGLQPSTAYSISAILAGRNVNVPTE